MTAKKSKSAGKIKPLTSQESMEIFFEVWSGKSVTDACQNATVKASFYYWCEINEVKPPKKGDVIKRFEAAQMKSAKKISKKSLSNENLVNKVREGIYRFSGSDASWAKICLNLVEVESKGHSGTVTPEEYQKLIESLFSPTKFTCQKCGEMNDVREPKKKPATKDNKPS